MSQVKKYKCPYSKCGKLIETKVPYPSEVTEKKPFWDSSVKCKHCDQLHFKVVYPDGRVQVTKVPQQKSLKL